MSALAPALLDFEGSSIRRTPDGRMSVYDVFSALEDTNPRATWKRIQHAFPEVVANCYNWQFPGERQRKTPITTAKGLLAILPHHPSKKVTPFRQWLTQIAHERLEEEASPELAYSRGRERAIHGWKQQGRNDAWIGQRVQGIDKRKSFASTLGTHGVRDRGYGEVTNETYRPILGGTAKEMRSELVLPVKANVRDHISVTQLAQIEYSETITEAKINQDNVQCAVACGHAARRAAQITAEAFSRYMAEAL